jgi:serine/threonine protein phosphatase PrpC
MGVASGLSVRASVRTDVGRRREVNEDWCGVWEADSADEYPQDGPLWVVADGVGAYGTGEEASRAAGEAVLERYGQARQADPALRLRLAMEAGNRAVRECRRDYVQQGQPRPVLTTLLAAALVGERMLLGNVGDCRAYLVRTGQISQLTRDHTWVAAQVADGHMSPAAARRHPRRHVVTRALGQDDGVEIDFFEQPLRSGDRVVLCSDGLTGHLADDEILRLAESAAPDAAAQAMVDLANERGGEDNITVAVIEAMPSGAAARSATPLRPAAERRDVTIFCASAGEVIASISERHAPEQVISLLNVFLATAHEVVLGAGGSLEMVPGGGVLACFGASLPGGDHVHAAISAAMQLQSSLASRGLRVSIGIDSGSGIVGTLGTLGTSGTMSRAVLGEVVSVAAHVRDAAQPGEVLVTGDAYARIADAVEVEELDPLCVPGRPQAFPIYRVIRVIA